MGNGFRKAFNIYAWIWNHLWGTLFLAGGVLALANADEVPVYIGLLCIVVGIYFYWSKSWSRAAKKAADAVYDRTRQADAPPAQAAGRPAAAPSARASAAPAESDPVTAKRITIARIVGIVGIAVIGGAFLWESSGISSDSMPIFLGLLGIGLAFLSVPGYIVRLLPSAVTPRVGPAASDAPGKAPDDLAESPVTEASTTTEGSGEQPATPAMRMNALNWVGAGLVAVAVIWIGGPGVRLTMLPVWLGLLAAGGALFYTGSRSSKGAASAPRTPVQHAQKPAAVSDAPAFFEEEVVEPAEEPSPEEFEAPVTADAGMLSARAGSSKLMTRGVVVVSALVIVAIVGGALVSGISKQIDKADRTRAAEERRADAAAKPPDEESEWDLTNYGALRTVDLCDRAPASGDMQFRDIVYTGAGEYFGGDRVLLGFMLVGPEGDEEYLADLSTDIGWYVDYEQVSFDDFQQGSYGASGMIVFDNEGVYELHVFTQAQKASAGTPEKDQVTVVPDYQTLDLPHGEWESLEFGEWFEAHDAAVEAAFREAGLVAVVQWESPESGDDEPVQEPSAGSVVPVGTTVNITIYTLE